MVYTHYTNIPLNSSDSIITITDTIYSLIDKYYIVPVVSNVDGGDGSTEKKGRHVGTWIVTMVKW